MDIPALQGAIAETGVPVHGVVDRDHWKDEFRLSSPNPEARERGRKGHNANTAAQCAVRSDG